MQQTEFTIGQIHPIDCAKEAWELIKDEYWMLFAVSFVGAMIGGISMYVLIGSMVCGIFYTYLKKIDGRGPVSLDDLWVGFKFFWPSLLVTVLIVVPLIIWMIFLFTTIYLPLIVSAMAGSKANGDELMATALVALVIDVIVGFIMVCFHSLLIFCFPLIVDRKVSSWDSVKLSARAVLKNLPGIGGLIAVNMVMVMAGYAACGFGLYLVIPVITATHVVAYRKVFPRMADAQ